LSRFLAIDADAGGIHIAAGTAARGGAVRLEQALTVPTAEPLTAVNAAEYGRLVKDALRAGGITAAPVLAAVGRDRVIVKDFKIPRVGPGEEPNLVRFQAGKEATEAPDAVVLDYFTLARDEPDGQVRAVTASVRKELVAAYKALCAAAGLKLAGITPRAIGTLAALERAVASGAVTEPEQKRASVAVLTRGEKWGELVIARDNQVVFARSMSATAVGSETALLGEMRRNLAVYNGQNPQQPVEAVYVAEAAGPGGWSGRIRAGLSVPVQAFDPLAGVDSHTPPDARGHFAALVGLIVLKGKPGRVPIDFAAPREPAAPKMGAKQKLAGALSLAALLIIGVLGFGYYRVMTKQTEFAKLVRQKTEMENDLKTMDEDGKRVKALQEWDESRINWLDELYDLTARFPDVKNAQVDMLRVESVPAQKGSKQKNVGKIDLKLSTNDEKLMTQLQGAMNADKKYHNLKKNIKATGGFRGGFAQTYEVWADIERRPANEYVRKLTATIPPRPARGRDDESGGFGGGIGGFGGPGQ
jgi:hypothetical protein